MKGSVIVTGGAGFIGSHLVERLIKHGYNTVVIDNFSTGKKENLEEVKESELCQIYNFDITDGLSRFLTELNLKNVTGIFHLAAQVSVQRSIENPGEDAKQNFFPIYELIDFINKNRGIKFLTFASSAAVYGDQSTFPIKENAACEPMSPYALHKMSCEYALKIFSQNVNMKIMAMRFFNVYGPKQDPSSQYSGVISKFLSASKNNEDLTIYGDGKQTRDFIYVDNVIDSLVASINGTDKSFDVVNVGNSSETTILYLAELINKISGREKHPLKFVDAKAGDIYKSVCNNEKLLKLVDSYKMMPLTEGLKKTFEWI